MLILCLIYLLFFSLLSYLVNMEMIRYYFILIMIGELVYCLVILVVVFGVDVWGSFLNFVGMFLFVVMLLNNILF